MLPEASGRSYEMASKKSRIGSESVFVTNASLLNFEGMRSISIFFFFTLILFSCNNSPVGNNPTKDSVVDTSKKNISKVDTQRIDTAHKIAVVENDCSV